MPTLAAPYTKFEIRDLSKRGVHRLRRLLMQGYRKPWVKPWIILQIITPTEPKVAAIGGMTMWKREPMVMVPTRNHLGPKYSLSWPAPSWVSMYPQKNEDKMISVSSHSG